MTQHNRGESVRSAYKNISQQPHEKNKAVRVLWVKNNVTGNNRVGALDEKLSQDLSGATFKLVRVTRRCQLDEHGGVGHSGRREQSVMTMPTSTSTPGTLAKQQPGPVSSVGDSVCVGRLQAMQGCVWQKMTLELDTWMLSATRNLWKFLTSK